MKSFWRGFFGSFLGCCVALFILVLVLFGLIGSIFSASSSEPIMPKSAILKIDFKTPITEQSTTDIKLDVLSMNTNFSESISLLNAIRAIEAAAKDPAIKFIYMTPESLNMEFSQAEEFRAALKKFRESGKAIISYSNNLGNGSYYMASVADRVILHPFGSGFTITGLSSNILFFKDLIDKLGVDVQLIRHGKYKAAGEQFTKNGLTPENREQNQVLLDAVWSSVTNDIAESRDFTAEDFNRWIDNLELVDAQSLLDRKMIDAISTQDEVDEYLCSLYDVKESKDLKFVTLDKYAKAAVKPNVRAKDKIAVIYASGEIVMDGPDNNISGIRLSQTISEVRKDSTIKAVVLRVNSPGGDAQAAELIKRELDLLKEVKPLIASYGSYAASGGYWISAGANKIFTDNTTITGSIGVFSLIPSFGKAISKNLHINMGVVSTNKHGDAFGGMRRVNAEEEAYMQSQVERIYTAFTELVADGRGMSVEAVDNIGQGRVWAGRDALQNGLADSKGGLVDALEYAAAVIGKENFQIVEYPVRKGAMEKIMEGMTSANSAVEIINDPMIILEKAYSSLKEETAVKHYARLPYIYTNIK